MQKEAAENCYIEEGTRAFLEKRKPRYTPAREIKMRLKLEWGDADDS